ncbi:uncharacterized protein BKA55DRAFT_553926 [Fusarium redolens]|uniref:Secreted protein n=1 Tax=Fusarium redolens TaxID=48865 RepID=A0A9P9KR30_FUSRE|nr:uncharacterized protein BKA55DRAFT_553926 [Fusarium redolens]KAH7266968.1 hypothetical protein BKA55DRAFT_553926 [Fusarium redolens]
MVQSACVLLLLSSRVPTILPSIMDVTARVNPTRNNFLIWRQQLQGHEMRHSHKISSPDNTRLRVFVSKTP